MKLFKPNQKGNAVLIAILIITLVVVIGASYLTLKNKKVNNTEDVKQVQQTNNSTSKKSVSTAYFTIKEWNVRAPYGGIDDTFSYRLEQNNQVATIISDTFAKRSPEPGKGCASFGAGYIYRVPETATATLVGDTGLTAKEYMGKYTMNFKLVNGYYYIFMTTNKLCGSGATPQEQAQSFSDVRLLIKTFVIVPRN